MQNSIAQYIEQTNLSPTITSGDIDLLVEKAIQYQVLGVCIPPYWVKKTARELKNTGIQTVTVIGFPLGYQISYVKAREIEIALRDGAVELDVVMNLSAFKNGVHLWVKSELAQFAQEIHQANALMKVILETAYLSADEIKTACQICVDSGADFVKTSTGFAPEGATPENVRLMRRSVPEMVGIKASGGIRTLVQARSLLEAGAERIGTSAGFAMIDEEKNQK